MRVGYVVKRYPRYSETFIVSEILAHEAAQMEVEIFALGFPGESHFQDVISRVRAPVRFLSAEGLRGVEFWAALEKAMRVLPGLGAKLEAARGEAGRDVYQALLLAQAVAERGLTHLHAHFATSASSVARLAAHFAGIPFSLTAHAKDIFHDDVDADDLRRKLRQAAFCATVSEFNAAYLRGNFGDDASRVVCVYNGLDLDRFPFDEPSQREPLIVGVGRLVEKKGFSDLVRACALLAREKRRFRCEIIGEGEQEASLRALIQELGMEEVVSLCGPRPQREIAERVQRAGVFAAPCVVGQDGNRDGLPTVLLEAMALGTPGVSTDVTGIPEVLRDGQTGLAVAQHDPPALARALAQLLDDADLRTRLALNARALVEEKFDAARNAARLREMFAQAQVEARVEARTG